MRIGRACRWVAVRFGGSDDQIRREIRTPGKTPSWPQPDPLDKNMIRNVLFLLNKLSNQNQPGFPHFHPTLTARTPHIVAAPSPKPPVEEHKKTIGPVLVRERRARPGMMKYSCFCKAVWIQLRNKEPTVTSNARCKIQLLFSRGL